MRFQSGEGCRRYRNGVMVIGSVISSGQRNYPGFEGKVLVTWETEHGLLCLNYEEELQRYRVLPPLVSSTK